MRNLSSFVLVILVLCSIIIQSSATKNLSLITWTHSLDTPHALDAYLRSDHGMAREGLSLKLPPRPIDPPDVMMGLNHNGQLTLSECLRKMKEKKRDFQELFLESSNQHIIKWTLIILKEHAPTANWITLNINMFRGPNGAVPEITPLKYKTEVLAKWPANIKKSFGMTTGYNGMDNGYSKEVLSNWKKDWVDSDAGAILDYDFCIDIYHISNTDPKQLEIMKDNMKNIKNYVLTTTEDVQDRINMTNFMAYLDTINITRSLFSVPAKFRKKLFPNESGRGYRAVDDTEVIIAMLFIGRILLKIKE